MTEHTVFCHHQTSAGRLLAGSFLPLHRHHRSCNICHCGTDSHSVNRYRNIFCWHWLEIHQMSLSYCFVHFRRLGDQGGIKAYITERRHNFVSHFHFYQRQSKCCSLVQFNLLISQGQCKSVNIPANT